MSVKIIVDSASDIDAKEADSLGVTLIPIQVRFENEEFLDGINLSHEEFFKKLVASKTLPKTSQINEFRFEEYFEKATKDGDEVVAILLSSKLSGTYSCACRAAEKFHGKVWVIDSLNACLGERLLCLLAVDLAKKGRSAAEISSELTTARHKIKLLALLDTLEYLKKGGRISATIALAGKILSVKPVVTIAEGEVKLAGKALGSKKGNNLLTKFITESNGVNFSLPYATGYSGTDDKLLKEYLHDSQTLWQGFSAPPVYMIGSTIGTHVGPGAIAVAFFEK